MDMKLNPTSFCPHCKKDTKMNKKDQGRCRVITCTECGLEPSARPMVIVPFVPDPNEDLGEVMRSFHELRKKIFNE